MNEDLETLFDLPTRPNLREQAEAEARLEEVWARLMGARP